MFKPIADNVLIALEPLDKQTASGIHVVRQSGPGAKEHRTARVIASGPGYKRPCCGAFIPNETRDGDRVIVDALAGDVLNYDWDVSEPRRNKIGGFEAVGELTGELRIVRESEILAVFERAEAAE